MGFNIQSSDTQNTLNDFTSVINTAVEEAKNKASLQCSSANNITVLLGSFPNPQTGTPIPCPTNVTGNITVNQTADSTCNLSGDFTTTFQNEITNNVQTNVASWINQNLNANQGWLAIAFSSQSAVNQTNETVATMISNGLTANITNTCSAELYASNNAIVSVCGDYRSDFNFDQSAFVTNLTSCIAKNTVSFIASNNILNSMSAYADSQLSSSQEGPLSWLKYVIIGIVIIVVLIIIGAIIIGITVVA